MATVQSLTRRFERVFEPEQAVVLAEVITDAYSDLVKTNDFNELKTIVKDLGHEVQSLSHEMQSLSQEMQSLSQEMQRLAQAQQRTEVRMDALAQDMQQMTRVVTGLGQEVGGLSRSMSYALENEAYRALPAFLREKHNILISERIVRTDIEGEEINFFALGTQNGTPICLVGESKLQLDERRNSRREAERLVDQIEAKVEAARRLYPDRQMIRLLVTHYARPAIQQFFREHNLLVVQTFEW